MKKNSKILACLFALVASQLSLSSPAKAATTGTGICQQIYTFSAGTESVTSIADGIYCYVAFKNPGAAGSTSSSYTWTKPSGITSLDVLVVGGGGGGGARHGGGGGGGSFVQATAYAVTSASTSLSIVVGSGGAGAPGGSTSYVGSKGNSSSFKIGANGLTALGGGAGVNGSTTDVNGGSGGGAGANQTAGTAGTSTQKTLDGVTTLSGIEFANAGATGTSEPNAGTSANKDYWAAGGGGGAGNAGKRPSLNNSEYTSSSAFPDGDGSNTRGGNGGDGKASTLVPTNVAVSLGVGSVYSGSTYFAAGGGGGIGADGAAGGIGGIGGGGNGSRASSAGASAAVVATGSGGGGSGFDDISPAAGDVQNPPGGAGASGVVILRYIPSAPTISASAAITGTTTFGQTLTSSTGSWNYGPTSYTYQWSRSSTLGGTYTTIVGATSNSYVVNSSDVGYYLKVAVTATNIVGSNTDTSTATSVVNTASSSATVSLAAGNLVFRTIKVISATPTVAGKLTFRANNVIIPGCKNVTAIANTIKNCSYRPSTRGYVTITVSLIPTDSGYGSTSTTSGPYFIYQRSGSRS